VTSAVFQLSLVIWPEAIKQHSAYVIAGWVLAGLLWLWWFVIRILEDGDKERPTTGIIQHSHGISNTGTMRDVTYNNIYNSPPNTDSKDPKMSGPTASEWDALGDRFLQCSKFARVDYQITHGVTRWDVKEDRTLEALCKKAGAMLLKSSKSRSALMPMLPNEEDTLSQWLEIVKRRTVCYNTGHGVEYLDDGSSLLHVFGSISGLADASYRLCMECAAYEI